MGKKEKLVTIIAEVLQALDEEHLKILERNGLDVEAGRRLSERTDARLATEALAITRPRPRS